MVGFAVRVDALRAIHTSLFGRVHMIRRVGVVLGREVMYTVRCAAAVSGRFRCVVR